VKKTSFKLIDFLGNVVLTIQYYKSTVREFLKLALTPPKQTGNAMPCYLAFWKDNNSGIKM
jgi:ABC-type sulfate transport system substrate-binding protein